MPTTASEAMSVRWDRAASGNSGIAYRQKPYVPIFSITPARIIDPATGACTCASGNQVCTGNMGTLMAKARAKAANSHGPYALNAAASGDRLGHPPGPAHAPSSLLAESSEL